MFNGFKKHNWSNTYEPDILQKKSRHIRRKINNKAAADYWLAIMKRQKRLTFWAQVVREANEQPFLCRWQYEIEIARHSRMIIFILIWCLKAAAAVGVCPKDICATNEFLQQLRKHRRRLVD